MRDYKFRGLGVDGKWWYGEQNPSGENHVNLAIFFPNVHAGAIRPETVGEWPGPKDKNGVEIYEGDIVLEWFLDNSERMGTIYLSDVGHIGWYLQVEGQGKRFSSYGVYKVIGNIYENPELLKEK